MQKSFRAFIKSENLVQQNEKVLLAVSGGIDSVCMCELFSKAQIPFGIAHCNFNLRGKESEADESFAEALSEHYGVPFHMTVFETKAFAKNKKLSVQAAARQLRYSWFEEIRGHFGYSAIATAHHEDDSIETFFINLIRGTGISGLHGIKPKQGNIIRPLLFSSKADILKFAKRNKLEFREDSSNASDKYLRNKIRLRLLPLLREMNPDISHTLLKNMERLQMTEDIYLAAIEKQRKKILKEKNNTISISIKKLGSLNPMPAYLFEFLRPFGFNASDVSDMIRSLDTQSGKQFFSDTHRLIRDRKELIVERKENGVRSDENKVNAFAVKKKDSTLDSDDLKLEFRTKPRTPNSKLPTDKETAALDFDKLKFPLEIRKWWQGDTFQPLGMKGKKKLSDFFIDRKFSLAKKDKIWLLTSGGNIVWIIGERIDDRFKIGPKTKKIYFVRVLS